MRATFNYCLRIEGAGSPRIRFRHPRKNSICCSTTTPWRCIPIVNAWSANWCRSTVRCRRHSFGTIHLPWHIWSRDADMEGIRNKDSVHNRNNAFVRSTPVQATTVICLRGRLWSFKRDSRVWSCRRCPRGPSEVITVAFVASRNHLRQSALPSITRSAYTVGPKRPHLSIWT